MGFQDTSECVDIDYCDLNFDGEIDVLDIVIILNCILENEGCDYLCMDYNSDNDIDILGGHSSYNMRNVLESRPHISSNQEEYIINK